MGKKIGILLNKSARDEKGQTLILVLVLLLVGGLIIAPLLAYMGNGIRTGLVFEKKTDELYAADAGVEDGLWQIKYDNLDLLTDPKAYAAYDYSTEWPYQLDEEVNDKDVDGTIENIWIPKDLIPPSETQAEVIIEGSGGDPPKMMITGNVPSEAEYRIKLTYYAEEGEELKVETLGVWLPGGFSYVADSSNLEDDTSAAYYSVPVTEPHCGGQAVVWSFNPPVLFADFPGIEGPSPFTTNITFQFGGPSGRSPATVSWIDTDFDLYGGITYTWDADTKVYRVTSQAGDTELEAYTAKSEIREMGGAIAGDYRAIGNSLMVDLYGGSPPIRDTLLDESDAEVSDIPSDAEVAAAYLYWSGWLAGDSGGQVLFEEDDCRNFNQWKLGDPSDWHISSSYYAFYAHHQTDGNRQLKMKDPLDLSSYGSGTVSASWRHWLYDTNIEDGDCLQYAFQSSGGSSSWNTAFCDDYEVRRSPVSFSVTIPDEYLVSDFKLKFKITGFGGSNEYCYIDDIRITVSSGTIADTSVAFEINGQQVYIDENGDPQTGSGEITASEWSVLENQPGEYSYACYRDVTVLAQEYSDEGDDENHTGNGTYTVGGVDGDTGNEWSYAAWSLIIIYSSPETQGHQLYLYDDFIYSTMDTNVDFDGDGEPGGIISGFLVPDPVEGEVNAAKLTCFVGEGDDYYNGDRLKFNGTSLSDGKSTNDVWNSWSVGLSEDGIDIDTFYVTWESDLLESGETSAQIDLPTQTDSWNLVYVILSFRSETTAGGTISYLIIQ